MKPEDLRKEFEKETGLISSDENINGWGVVSEYVEWLEKRLLLAVEAIALLHEGQGWRTDTPPEDVDIILKTQSEGKIYKFMGRYKNGHYYDDLLYPIGKDQTVLGWFLIPE